MFDYENDAVAELAWMAGIFEGEGTSRVTTPHSGFGIEVRISNSDMDILEPFLLYGGRIVERPRKAIRTVYEWQRFGPGAKEFLHAILPYIRCVRKRMIAERCADFPNMSSAGKASVQFRQKQEQVRREIVRLTHP